MISHDHAQKSALVVSAMLMWYWLIRCTDVSWVGVVETVFLTLLQVSMMAVYKA